MIRNVIHILFLVLLTVGLNAQECIDVEASDMFGNSNVIVDCDYAVDENVCLDLQVDYNTIPSTDSYDFSSIPFDPDIPFNQGIPLTQDMEQENGVVDDKFSELIPLGFTFCYFDQAFQNIVIGTNGILTFDVNEAGADCPSGISVSNPNSALIDDAIFAVQHDMLFDLNDDSEIYYSTIGEAPCRKFIVNYFNANVFGCPDKSTIQIVLHEFSNEIEVHILDKPEHCPNGRDANALLGIMNSDGTQGISPPGRNTGEWSALNESWQFFPNGNIPPIVVWYDDLGNEVGQGGQISVCPNRNTVYTAEIQYQSCAGNDVFGRDNVNVRYAAEFPAVENESVLLCDRGNDGFENISLNDFNGYISLNNTTNFNFSYYNSLSDAQNQIGAISNITLTGNRNFFVRIENTFNTNCFTITEISFSFDAAQITNLEITLCDNNRNGVETNEDLLPYIDEILDAVDYESYMVFNSRDDANSQTNPITSATIRADSQFWLYLSLSDDCQQVVGPITINFLEAPPRRSAETIFFSDCDVNYNFSEPFPWPTQVPLIMNINPGESFTVHRDRDDALRGSRPQTQISDRYNPYYARIRNSSGCFTIVEIPVEVEFFDVEANGINVNVCFDGTEDITVDLSSYPEQMLIDPLTGVDISLYDNADDANNHVIENIIDPIQTVTEDGYFVERSFFVRFQVSEDCYTVRPIRIRLIHPIPMANPIDVCDILNDNMEENNLSIYDSLILGDQNGNITYYLNQNDAENNTNALTTYEFTENVTLYVRISRSGCHEIYPIDFQLASVPPSQNLDIYLGQICDTNGNGLTEIDLTVFESEAYTGEENVTFTYYETYDEQNEILSNPIENPQLYPVTGSVTIFLEIVGESIVCNAVSSITLGVDFSDTFEISPAELYACDFQFDLNEEFNLNDALPQITTGIEDYDPDLYEITYHRTQEDADNNENPLSNIFIPNSAQFPIYVKFRNRITDCSATNILTLFTVGAPKPVASAKAICDNNLNGMYDLDLSDLGFLVMEGDIEGYSFTYHLTENDAELEINALDPNVIFETAPFPSQIWVRVENLEDCFDSNYVDISFNSLTQIDDVDLYQYSCDENNDGFSNFDLTFVEEFFSTDQYVLEYYENLEQINNYEPALENPSDYTNTIANNQTVIVKISEVDACPVYAEIELEVIPTPQVTVDPAQFCPGETTDVFPNELIPNVNYSYEWYNPANELISNQMNLLNIGEEGTYTVVITDEDFPLCQNVIEVEISPYNPPVILDIVEEGNTITVLATGDYAIEYSMDGENWQGLNYFTDLEPGVHTFYVRYIVEGCLGEPKRGIIFNIHNVITPNGDGYNDEIRIDNLDVFDGEVCTMQIYDRYGKLIFNDASNTSIVWDGKYLGRVVNTTSYWYFFRTPDGRYFNGNITVKNY